MTSFSDLYQARREAFMAKMANGIALIPSATMTPRNNDVEYEFRQDSDFFYLTGLDEPDCLLVLTPQSESTVTLFVRPRDPEREAWDGPRAGVQGAIDDFGADAAFPISEARDRVRDLLTNEPVLYYALGCNTDWDATVIEYLVHYRKSSRKGVFGPTQVEDPLHILHEMRLIKSADEVEVMAKAASISASAHTEAMRFCRPGVTEAHLQSVLEYVFRVSGAKRQAYSPIVATRNNATVLHYVLNNAPVGNDDLVLIDAGCEYGYMASDITRTFPASGQLSQPQRELYQLVLDAQLAAIDLCRPGNTFESVHDRAVEVLTEGMIKLGMIEGPLDKALEEERYKAFYFHRTGHWLGMDVHDVGQYQSNDGSRPLEPGMVLTVEPGIYVKKGHELADAQYHGIGIRIEDDVVVTDGEPRVLTADVPKEIDAIERVMADQSSLTEAFAALR